MKRYNTKPGQHIRNAATEMIALANESGETITAEFNGIQLKANPGDDASRIVQAFEAKYDRRREARRSSGTRNGGRG